ncbi:MAG: glycosyltransferase [Bacteroidales bacterium]|nr:glycosyltransferase [Bacteroidales bacterium]
MNPINPNKKSKTGILIGSMRTGAGGAEKQAVLLSGILAASHDVYFIVINGNEISAKLHEVITEQPVNRYFLKGNFFKRFHQLLLLFIECKPEILICYLTYSNFLGGILGKIFHIPHVIGGIRSSKLGKFKFIIQRFTHNHLTGFTIFNNHKGVENFTGKRFNPSKTLIIPNGIEVEREFYFRSEKSNIQIITVGRFVEAKDFKTALRSIQVLVSILPDNTRVKYLIVGFGELEDKILMWIKELNLGDHVQIIHKPSNLKEIYQEADIYLCTSYYEGLSNSILEAMNQGLPIVGTDVGDNNHLILDHQTGYITPPYDYHTIAEKLKDLVLDYPKRIRFGEKGFAHCAENYSIEKLTMNYLAFINALKPPTF